MTEEPLLSVRDLEKHYPITEGLLRREVGRVRAVDGVSFDVRPGEAFGLVGESGCGKSTTALSLLRLEEPTGGEVRFDGDDVLGFDEGQLRAFRRRAQLVLQDPSTAFNPRQTIGEAVAEPLRVHGLADADRRRQVVEDTLERVGLSGEDADGYPHEFSGGEKQRVAIARALVLNPDLIVADEPVSALDGRTKTDVLDLLNDLRTAFDLSVLLISHDVDMVRRFCDRVAVMYLGSVVERGTTAEVVEDPRHPYTQMLVSSVPSLDPHTESTSVETPSDELPDASDVPDGCRFHPRCPAIIPPEDVDMPHDQWLDVVSLRFYLADDWEDAATARQSLPAPATESPASRGAAERIRAAFGLPASLPDPTVEDAVSGATEALENGDLDAARERLAGTVTSVCERESPELTDEHASRPVACHRYDPDQPGDPDVGIEHAAGGE
jgi:peptide/nickel transport system ATP-binding protein